jgi:large repetitive protein
MKMASVFFAVFLVALSVTAQQPQALHIVGVPPEGMVGVPYSCPLGARHGVGPYTWTLTGGALPEGLELTADGKIVGTPSKAVADQSFEVTVTDPSGKATKSFRMTIDPPRSSQ